MQCTCYVARRKSKRSARKCAITSRVVYHWPEVWINTLIFRHVPDGSGTKPAYEFSQLMLGSKRTVEVICTLIKGTLCLYITWKTNTSEAPSHSLTLAGYPAISYTGGFWRHLYRFSSVPRIKHTSPRPTTFMHLSSCPIPFRLVDMALFRIALCDTLCTLHLP